MNLDLIKEKLAALKGEKSGASKLIWKPKNGRQTIRFLPYIHDKDWPITELSFHYDITGTSILSPNSFGKPDPINEFADKLRQTGEKEDFLQSRKISSKQRWFAPIIVRGEETEGVKFWGFSKTILEQILTFASDEDFGDFTDPKSGRDFYVDFTPAASSEAYPETKLAPKMKTSPVTDSKEVLQLMKEMPDVKTLFKTMTYDELKDKLVAFLTPKEPSDGSNDTVIEEDEEDDFLEAANASKPTGTNLPPAEKADKPAPKSTAITDLDSEFEAMFN